MYLLFALLCLLAIYEIPSLIPFSIKKWIGFSLKAFQILLALSKSFSLMHSSFKEPKNLHLLGSRFQKTF